MKIRRNYLDPTYCPVLWLMVYFAHTKHDDEDGPIWRKTNGDRITPESWTGMTNYLFVEAGIRMRGVPEDPETGEPARRASGCSNHSIRRSAAQWAGRCGAREMDVRNAGRWRSMVVLAKYMAQGAMERDAYEDLADDVDGQELDPIFRMFVFKKATSAAVGGQDIM